MICVIDFCTIERELFHILDTQSLYDESDSSSQEHIPFFAISFISGNNYGHHSCRDEIYSVSESGVYSLLERLYSIVERLEGADPQEEYRIREKEGCLGKDSCIEVIYDSDQVFTSLAVIAHWE